jgi:hypothetical protein
MVRGMGLRCSEMGAQSMVADADLSGAFKHDMAREYAPAANYGFGPVVLAAFGFWGVVGVSFSWVLHHA